MAICVGGPSACKLLATWQWAALLTKIEFKPAFKIPGDRNHATPRSIPLRGSSSLARNCLSLRATPAPSKLGLKLTEGCMTIVHLGYDGSLRDIVPEGTATMY